MMDGGPEHWRASQEVAAPPLNCAWVNCTWTCDSARVTPELLVGDTVVMSSGR